jgi:hypothetical protein
MLTAPAIGTFVRIYNQNQKSNEILKSKKQHLMKVKSTNLIALILTIILFSTSFESYTQIPDFSKVPNMAEGDSTNIVYLINNGVRFEKGKVIAWFPKDSLSKERISGILDTLNFGIDKAEKFIKAPYTWQVQQKSAPYTFYFRFDKIIPHASGGGFVSVYFRQIKSGKAPWLHEAIHEMLNTKAGDWLDSTKVTEEEWATKMPLWLQEGLADYIAIEVSQIYHLNLYDLFTDSKQKNLDTLFKEEMKNDKITELLTHIGGTGTMKELFAEDDKSRKHYGGAFYHLSASFVKYLADKYGIKTLVESNAVFKNEMAELEKRMNSTLEKEKLLWINRN